MRRLSGMEQLALSMASLAPRHTVKSRSLRIASMVLESGGYLDRLPGLQPTFVINETGRRALLAERARGDG